MKLKKQELVKKIGGVDVLFSKIKYSILYLIIVEKKSDKGNIIERYIKWGRTTNPVSRFKQHQKHYIVLYKQHLTLLCCFVLCGDW